MGERVAIFRHDGKVVSDFEGLPPPKTAHWVKAKSSMACVTCPWHGYQ